MTTDLEDEIKTLATHIKAINGQRRISQRDMGWRDALIEVRGRLKKILTVGRKVK